MRGQVLNAHVLAFDGPPNLPTKGGIGLQSLLKTSQQNVAIDAHGQ